MLELIKREIKNIENHDYYGCEKQIENENIIVRFSFKDFGLELEYNETIEEFYKRVFTYYLNDFNENFVDYCKFII